MPSSSTPARGGLVDEDALFAALAEERIAGAGIDVRKAEPNTDWRFNEFDSIIQTPYAAPATPSASLACTRLAAEVDPGRPPGRGAVRPAEP